MGRGRIGERARSLARAVGAVAALAALGACPSVARADPPPNVVVVMTDDQAAHTASVMENTRTLIGARGATFANSFVNWPLCCPSRATFLTGQYAHNHGVRGNRAPEGGFSAFRGRNSLAPWLSRAGYHTVHVGKYLNGYASTDPAWMPRGWSEWYATGLREQYMYDYTLNENGIAVPYGTEPADYKTDVLTGRAIEVIRRRVPRHAPLFLTVMYNAPHVGGPSPSPQPPADCDAANGADPPQPAIRHMSAFDTTPLPTPLAFNEADLSDKPAAMQTLPSLEPAGIANLTRSYRCELESLLAVDEGVGRIVRALGAAGELRNTVVAYTSDNGYFHGEHRIRAGKNRVYEPSIRVPLMVRGPGIPAGARVRDPVINADLAPTIIELSGARAGLEMDGRSLLAATRDPRRRTGRALLIDTESYKAVRTDRYLYSELASGETEMYDLDRDPQQLHSLHGDPYHPARAALAGLLSRLVACTGERCHPRPRIRMEIAPDARRGCREPALTVRLRGGERDLIRRAAFLANRRRLGFDGAAPFTRRIGRDVLGSRRTARIEARVELMDGRRMTLTRRPSVCA